MKPTLTTAFAFAMLLLPLNVDAQQHDATAADALFRQGRQAMKRGDFATACPKFKESQRLDPAAGTVLNLAECEEKLGLFASALQHYQEALDLLGAGDPRIRVAKAGLASAKKQAPKLTVSLPPDAPKGTTVLRDGVELGEASIGTALPIDPGDHVLVTIAPGHEDHIETISIAAEELKESMVGIGVALAEAPAGESDDTAPVPNPTTDTSSDPILAYVMGGVGILGVAAGSYFTLQARSLNEEATAYEHFHPDKTYSTGFYCDDVCYSKTQDSRLASKLGYGFLAGGGLLVAGATAMLLLSETPADERGDEVALEVAVGDGTMGVRLGGAW